MSSVNALVAFILAIVVASQASPLPQRQQQQISSISIPGHSQVRDSDNQYNFHTQHHDGTTLQEQGQLKVSRDGLGLVLVKSGSYSYISPEGRPISITYLADEDGFRPVGDAIPQSQPPVPATFF